jgi:hypothetical protein
MDYGEQWRHQQSRKQRQLDEANAEAYAKAEYDKFLLTVPEHIRAVVEEALKERDVRYLFYDEKFIKKWLEVGIDGRFHSDFRIGYYPEKHYSLIECLLRKETDSREYSYTVLGKVKDLDKLKG